MPDERFVTVLKTSDPRLIDVAVATLEAEGIPFQHPGKNLAALVPGMSLIEIELRVPESVLADATALMARLRGLSSEQPAERIAFRVSRSYAKLGALIGAILGVVWINVSFRSAPELISAAAFAGAISGGFLLGRLRVRYSCSQPNCGGALASSAVQCDKCGARIAGSVASARDHFRALERRL